jgi:hypothetical protein
MGYHEKQNKKGGKGGEQGGEVVGCCCRSRYRRSRCSRYRHCHSRCHLLPIPAGDVVATQRLRARSRSSSRPAVSLGSPRSCSLALVCPRRRSSSVPLVSGPHLSPLGCPCARRCSSPSVCWSPFLFGFRSRSFVLVRFCLCLFGFVCAHLASVCARSASFVLVRAWLGSFGLVCAHLHFGGFLFGLPSLSFVSVSNIWLV